MKRRVLVITLVIGMLAVICFVVVTRKTAAPPENAQYLDELKIETRDPQPAGRNISPESL